MLQRFADWIIGCMSKWLLKEEKAKNAFLCDFETICTDIKRGDVLLIEGKTRVSRIIQRISQSAWSHATLYIGRLEDIEDEKLRDIAKSYAKGFSTEQLLIESQVGEGTILSPISKYKNDHIRILRPRRLTKEDARKLINSAICRLGRRYNVRHILDLARFLFPWGLWPRKWRSTLFEHNALQPTEDICSSMIADAFQSIRYPVLPLVKKNENGQWVFIQRSSRLFTPRDFDYSPYFDVIKYPILPLEQKGDYQKIPWKEDSVSPDGVTEIPRETSDQISGSTSIQQFFSSSEYAVIGASADRKKYGNKVLRCYMQHNRKVWPVNPDEKRIEGLKVIQKIKDLPSEVKSISVVTPPAVTEQIVEQAALHGIENIWMQPGADSPEAIEKAQSRGMNVIANGICILMMLGFNE